MKANSLVSILVPVYNVKDYIARCLESIGSQTVATDIECIIVDDCGNDGSIEIAENFISSYNGGVSFRIIHHEHNRGLSAARNTAVENATGEFVCHVDSDDWLEKDAIESLVKKQQEKNYDIVTGLALAEHKHYKAIIELREYPSQIDMTRDIIRPSIRHAIWGRLIRLSLYKYNNIEAKEGTNVGEDVQVMSQLSYYAKRTVNIYRLVYHYNCENDNSYLHDVHDIKKKCKKCFQDVDSYVVVRDFFNKRDEICKKEAETSLSIFTQLLMGYYLKAKDRKSFNKIKNLYETLECGLTSVTLWHRIHGITFYSYWYCRFTYVIFNFFRISKLN